VASSKKARDVEQRAARVERSAWEKTSRKSSGGKRGEQSWAGVDSGQAEVMLGVWSWRVRHEDGRRRQEGNGCQQEGRRDANLLPFSPKSCRAMSS
jgi:hypothetical protein